MRTISFNTFDGGMTNEPRDPREDVCRVIKHFDNYTRSHKLSPYRSMKLAFALESDGDQYRISKLCSANNTLYGIGTVSSSDAHSQVYTLVTPGDPTTSWTTAGGTSTSATSVESNIAIIPYQNNLYGVNTGGVWKYGDITGSPGFTYNDYTTHIPTAPGVVHSRTGIMYWPSNNLILQNSGGSWSVGLTLPTGSVANSICEDGGYLSIGADNPDGTSTIYRWDMDTTLTNLPEIINAGSGSIKLIENIGGVLSWVSTTSANLSSLTPRVMFKYYTGTRVVTFQEFVCSLVTIIPDKQTFNNQFYFLAEMTIDGTVYKGLWKIFKAPNGNMTVSFDKLPRNDTALTPGSLKGFVRWGDYTFISYLNPADTKFTLWRTDDQPTYTATSIIESTINPGLPEKVRGSAGIRSNKKQMFGCALSTEPLTSGQSAILKVRADGGSWVTVVTSTTVGDITKENTWTSTNTKIPNAREYEFRLESTGGAEITEVKYKIDVNETQL